jgi:hypothetical protein
LRKSIPKEESLQLNQPSGRNQTLYVPDQHASIPAPMEDYCNIKKLLSTPVDDEKLKYMK